jgi:hypothetical protein
MLPSSKYATESYRDSGFEATYHAKTLGVVHLNESVSPELGDEGFPLVLES